MRSARDRSVRRKSNFGIHAGEQLPVGVRYLNLGEQGARHRLKTATGPHHSCIEGVIWNFSDIHPRVLADNDPRRVRLGDVDINKQGVDACDAKEFRTFSCAIRGNKRAIFNVARSDDAGERRSDFLQAL